MARVQSILTYTLPALSDCPPAAPINCGCHNLVLILEDLSLIRTALHGILEVEIKSVTVSSTPVKHVDSASGETKLVWKYDYLVEYKDTDLTDPTYRIRKCDVMFNCCYACAQAYTDRKLKGYVESVTGAVVNNTDPQNPIITINPDSLVGGVNQFTHTSIAGAAVTIPFGHTLSNPTGSIIRLTRPDGSVNDLNICSLVAAACPAPPAGQVLTAGCGIAIVNNQVSVRAQPGLDWPYACPEIGGSTIFCSTDGALRGEPPYTSIGGDIQMSNVDAPCGPGSIAIDNNGTTVVPNCPGQNGAVIITNPSLCRNMIITITMEAVFLLFDIKSGKIAQGFLDYTISGFVASSSAVSEISQLQSGVTAPNGMSITIRIPRTHVITLAPGASTIVNVAARISHPDNGSNGNRLGGGGSRIAYHGTTV